MLVSEDEGCTKFMASSEAPVQISHYTPIPQACLRYPPLSHFPFKEDLCHTEALGFKTTSPSIQCCGQEQLLRCLQFTSASLEQNLFFYTRWGKKRKPIP